MTGSGTVTDLLTRRNKRGRPALVFANPTEALAYATTRVRDLEQLTGSALLIDAKELSLPLAQVAAILDECARIVHENSTIDDGREGRP